MKLINNTILLKHGKLYCILWNEYIDFFVKRIKFRKQHFGTLAHWLINTCIK